MMSERSDLVIEALTLPAPHFEAWRAAHWTRLLQQARGAGLLGRVGMRLRSLWPERESAPWPANFESHLASARRVQRAQRAEVERELLHLRHALDGLAAPVVLLKGAAYLAAGLPPGQARVFSDVDVLVPKDKLAEAESRLMLHGWASTNGNAYDQRYYREWMHELPPMQHVHRGTTLDLHHNILPETARLRPSGRRLAEAAVPVPGLPGLSVLDAPDMVLHCATHLFMNEEMSHALRDLSDLDLLLRHFAPVDGFWERLIERATLLELQRPLHYGLRHATRVFGTPATPGIEEFTSRCGPFGPLQPIMDGLWERVLHSPHPGAAPTGSALASFALYVRGHWLRMPPALLARHLTIKALRLHQQPTDHAAEAPTNG